jgi:hypothetical protein
MIMDNLSRRRRVNDEGEWEYECPECSLWLPKTRFKGCVDKIDAFGNCLICVSCRVKNANKKRLNTLDDGCIELLEALGYNTSSKIPVWKQFNKRHGIKEK